MKNLFVTSCMILLLISINSECAIHKKVYTKDHTENYLLINSKSNCKPIRRMNIHTSYIELPQDTVPHADSLAIVIKYLKTITDILAKDSLNKDEVENFGKLYLSSKRVDIYDLGKSPCLKYNPKKIFIPKEKWDKDDPNFTKYDSISNIKYDTLFVSDDYIKEVQITIENAGIYDIRVETDSGLVFVNNNYIIPLLNWEKRPRMFRLYLASSSQICGYKDAYIFVDDFLDYKASKRFKMDDTSNPIILTKSDSSVDLLSSMKLDNLVNFRIYSDVLALINQIPNGLVQFEADAKFYINLIPCHRFYFFKYLKPFGNLSKFDSQLKYITLNDRKYNSNTQLNFLQKSSVYSGIEFNILSYVFPNGNTNVDLNLGGSYFFSPYQLDTIVQSDNLQSIGYFINAKIITKRISNFIFDYGPMLMLSVPYQTSGIEYSNDFYWTGGFTGEFRYIIGTKDEIFLRARYIGDGENAFNQIQIGYKAQIPIHSKKY